MRSTGHREQMRVAATPGALAEAVLTRAIGMAASRSALPIDRVEGAIAAAEILSANLRPALVSDRIELLLDIGDGLLTVDVGVLGSGSGRRLLGCGDSSGAALERLASAAVQVTASGGEHLVLQFIGTAGGQRRDSVATPSEQDGFELTVLADVSTARVIAIRGDVDLSTAPQIERAAADAVAAGDRRLVLDLTAATFLDSTGLGVIIRLVQLLGEDGRVAIANRDDAIATTLELSGVTAMVPVLATRDDAIAATSG